MSTATDTDTGLSTLAAERHLPGCEHPYHTSRASTWHADGGEHYIRFAAPCGHVDTTVKVVCAKWLAVCHEKVNCLTCDEWYSSDIIIDLGPVTA